MGRRGLGGRLGRLGRRGGGEVGWGMMRLRWGWVDGNLSAGLGLGGFEGFGG